VFTLITIVWSVQASAQVWKELREQPPEEVAKSQTDFWTRTLGLTSEQAAALHEINRRYANDMRLAARLPGDDASKLDGMEALEDARAAEIIEVLTTEQRQRYLQFIGHRQHLVRKAAPQ
jgi:hypothetical protein